MGEAAPRIAEVAELGERMRAFLADEALGGPEIVDLVGHLGQLGEVAIFGGMPRDIARAGVNAFASDVDLVIDAAPGRLAELFRCAPVRKNRFGGYRIDGRRHSYDVWALSSTWAVEAGHVRASCLDHLVLTTFFNCDAVIYRCKANRIHHGKRFETWLRDRVVEVNLEKNPNPAGAVGRALRAVLEWEHAAGPCLVRYLERYARSTASHLDDDTADRLARVIASYRHSSACHRRLRRRAVRVASRPSSQAEHASMKPVALEDNLGSSAP